MHEDNKKEQNTNDINNNKTQSKTGRFIFANGDVYDGEYELNESGSIERQGYGTFTSKSGVIYKGNWNNDKMNGHGTFMHPSGMKYEGEFLNGKFDGFGKYMWPDGFYYEGEFKSFKIEGRGFIRDPNGQIWLGKFERDYANGLKFKLSV